MATIYSLLAYLTELVLFSFSSGGVTLSANSWRCVEIPQILIAALVIQQGSIVFFIRISIQVSRLRILFRHNYGGISLEFVHGLGFLAVLERHDVAGGAWSHRIIQKHWRSNWVERVWHWAWVGVLHEGCWNLLVRLPTLFLDPSNIEQPYFDGLLFLIVFSAALGPSWRGPSFVFIS